MTGGEVHEISRAIGELQAGQTAVVRAVTELTLSWREQDRQAAESRRLLHESFNELKTDLRERLVGLEGRVEGIESELDKIKPDVEHWKTTRAAAKGVGAVAHGFSNTVYYLLAIAGIIAAFFAGIHLHP